MARKVELVGQLVITTEMREQEMDQSIFTLSIEPFEGKSYQYGFHLGTIESEARKCAEEIWNRKRKEGPKELAHGRVEGCRTVALIRDRRIYDVFDGVGWFNRMIEE